MDTCAEIIEEESSSLPPGTITSWYMQVTINTTKKLKNNQNSLFISWDYHLCVPFFLSFFLSFNIWALLQRHGHTYSLAWITRTCVPFPLHAIFSTSFQQTTTFGRGNCLTLIFIKSSHTYWGGGHEKDCQHTDTSRRWHNRVESVRGIDEWTNMSIIWIWFADHSLQSASHPIRLVFFLFVCLFERGADRLWQSS